MGTTADTNGLEASSSSSSSSSSEALPSKDWHVVDGGCGVVVPHRRREYEPLDWLRPLDSSSYGTQLEIWVIIVPVDVVGAAQKVLRSPNDAPRA